MRSSVPTCLKIATSELDRVRFSPLQTDSLVDCCTTNLPLGNSEEGPPPKQALPKGR